MDANQSPVVHISGQLPALLGTVPIIASLCYGFGWSFFSALLRPIGLSVEEAGLSPGFMAVRAAYLLLAILALLAVVLCVFDVFDAPSKAEHAEPRPLIALILSFSMLLALAAGVSWWILADNLSFLAPVGVRVPAVCVAVFATALCNAGLVLRSFGYKAGGASSISGFSSAHAMAAVLIWGAVGISASFAIGNHFGKELRAGSALSLPAYEIQRGCVEVEATPTERCGLVFGTGSGVLTIYNPQARTKKVSIAESRVLAVKWQR